MNGIVATNLRRRRLHYDVRIMFTLVAKHLATENIQITMMSNLEMAVKYSRENFLEIEIGCMFHLC
jgi:hypothetical protein